MDEETQHSRPLTSREKVAWKLLWIVVIVCFSIVVVINALQLAGVMK